MPRDGESDRANATSLAFDRQGRLHVSSRFDGSVHRVDARGRSKIVATDLGVACGLAFAPDGDLYVGDRSGSVLRVSGERTEVFASLPSSIAAFHLAFGPDGFLYVAAPTISSFSRTGCSPPPRLSAFFARAWFTRIWRIAVAATAKKCRRSFHSPAEGPTSLRNAS